MERNRKGVLLGKEKCQNSIRACLIIVKYIAPMEGSYMNFIYVDIVYANKNMSEIFENGREKESYKAARMKAEEVLKSNNLSDSRNVGIVQLAKKYGFVVATAKMPEKMQGMIVYDESGTKKQMGTDYAKLIVVDSKLTTEQKRFVVAHELGHYIMGNRADVTGEHIEMRIDKHDEKPEKENEIDYFAACILMPHNAVKKMVQLDEPENALVEELSRAFGVSSIVAKRRIQEVRQLENCELQKQ